MAEVMPHSKAFSYEVDETSRLDVYLTTQTGLSRQFIQEQIRAGRILRNDRAVTKASQKLAKGDRISGQFKIEERLDLIPVAHPLDVIFEDDCLLVLNKPQGMVVHPAVGHRGETLVHYLLHYFHTSATFASLSPSRPGIVHRLDRGTSGCLLIAKDRGTQEALSSQFKSRHIKKEYESIVWGKIATNGEIKSLIGRDKTHRKRMSSNTDKGRASLTRFERAEQFAHFSHVRLFPHTGRTHQLRVHMSENGHPIAGDALYARRGPTKQIAVLPPPVRTRLEEARFPLLHAKRLQFAHPRDGKAITCEAPAPASFTEFLSVLRASDV